MYILCCAIEPVPQGESLDLGIKSLNSTNEYIDKFNSNTCLPQSMTNHFIMNVDKKTKHSTSLWSVDNAKDHNVEFQVSDSLATLKSDSVRAGFGTKMNTVTIQQHNLVNETPTIFQTTAKNIRNLGTTNISGFTKFNRHEMDAKIQLQLLQETENIISPISNRHGLLQEFHETIKPNVEIKNMEARIPTVLTKSIMLSIVYFEQVICTFGVCQK